MQRVIQDELKYMNLSAPDEFVFLDPKEALEVRKTKRRPVFSTRRARRRKVRSMDHNPATAALMGELYQARRASEKRME